MPAILSLIQQGAANHKRDYQASLFSLFDSTPNSNCDVEAAPQSTSAHCAVCEAANHSFKSGFYREIFPIEQCGTPSLLLSDGSQRQKGPKKRFTFPSNITFSSSFSQFRQIGSLKFTKRRRATKRCFNQPQQKLKRFSFSSKVQLAVSQKQFFLE